MNFREYHSGSFLRKVTFNFNLKKVLTKHRPSQVHAILPCNFEPYNVGE